MRRRSAVAAAVMIAYAAAEMNAGQQAPAPAFEVASVRRNTATAFGFPGLMLQPGGRAVSPGSSVRQLILTAYGLDDLQLLGGPSWIASDLYAIDARAGDGATRASVRLMLRALLQERFQLMVHTEQRELPAYALVWPEATGDWVSGSGGPDPSARRSRRRRAYRRRPRRPRDRQASSSRCCRTIRSGRRAGTSRFPAGSPGGALPWRTSSRPSRGSCAAPW